MRDVKGNAWAYLVDKESKVQRRPLMVERTIGDQWLVTSGLAPGDRVVITGVQSLQRVQPGMVVKEVPPGAARPATAAH